MKKLIIDHYENIDPQLIQQGQDSSPWDWFRLDFYNEAIVCLKNDNKIIWSSMIIFHPFQTFIYRFGIDPLYHGKWFWSLLCQYIEETLISKQMFHPTLFVEEENTIWIQFRSSHGRENLYKVECFVKNLEYVKDT